MTTALADRSPQRPAVLALASALLLLIGLVLPGATHSAAAAACGTTDLALNRPATASSTETTGPGYSAANAVDGSTTTRWASAFSDPQWLQVDLGSTQQICQVVLNWETGSAKSYQIQTSSDGGTWTSVYSTTGGPGGTETLNVSGTGRYVRMYGTQRNTGYGYSLWEFTVHGVSGTTGSNTVQVTGGQGNWQLTLNGSPYQVKGVTWGPAISDAEKYMPGLQSMGVNTIRTWGTDGSTLPLLDSAAAHGIKVISGFWLQPGGGPGSGGCVDYLTDTTYKTNMLAEIKKWVTAYKDHPGVLMWNVGNESVLGMQNCYSGNALEQERKAYTTFVNDVARALHAIDPNHPVTSTDAWTGAWPYYKANAPDLDLYAVNAYNAVCGVQKAWTDGGYTKPYIITETGPAGEWEVPNDANGVPNEPTDLQKRDGYTNAWKCITAHKGVALGATMFHYGIEQDFGGVWFNLIPGGLKRLSYYSIAQAYGGPSPADTPPVISNMVVSDSTAVPAGHPFTVKADVRDPDGDPITYKVLVSAKYVNGDGKLTEVPFSQTGAGTFSVTAPQQLGVWKVYLQAQDGKGNVGIETKSFRVVPPAVNGTNVALGRPATASSFQSFGNLVPGNATDGRFDTRWASDWSDPQWIQVDLGKVTHINHVQLVWETSYGKAYTVQTSDDGSHWTTVYQTAAGDGGVDDFDVNGSGRYIRMNATVRGTQWGYSLWEFGIYN